MKSSVAPLPDPLLDSLSGLLDRGMAAKLIDFRFDTKTQTRIDKLARKCSDGRLTEEERREYESFVHAIDFIARLQLKARKLLKQAAAEQ